MVIRGPQVSLDAGATPGFSAPAADTFQGNQGEEIQRAGAAVSRLGGVAVRIQEEQDISSAKRADSLIADAVRTASYDSDTGYLNTVGQDAVDRHKDAERGVDDEVRRIADTVQSAGARERLAPMLRQRVGEARARFGRHVANQTRIQAVGSAEARLRTFAVDYVDALQDPESGDRAAVAFGGAMHEARELAALKGLGAEETEELVLEATSGIHAGAVRMMVNNGLAVEARDYLEGVGDDVSLAVRTELQGLIKSGTIKERGMQIAHGLGSTHATLTEQTAALDDLWVKKKVTVEERHEANRLLNQQADQRHQELSRSRTETLTEAKNWAQLNKGTPLPPELEKRLRDVDMLDDLQVWELNGGRDVSTPAGRRAFLRITKQSLLDDYPTVESLDAAWQSELDEGRMAKMREKWAEARQPGPDAISITLPKQVLGLLKQKGILGADDTLDDDTTAGIVDQWQSAVTQSVNGTVTGRKAVMDDVTQAFGKVYDAGFDVGERRVPLSFATDDQKEAGVINLEVDGKPEQIDIELMKVPQRGLRSFDELVDVMRRDNEKRKAAGDPEVPITSTEIGYRWWADKLAAEETFGAEVETDAVEERQRAATGAHQAMRRARDLYETTFAKEMRITPEGIDQRVRAHNRAMTRMWNEHGVDVGRAGIDRDAFLRQFEDAFQNGKALPNLLTPEMVLQLREVGEKNRMKSLRGGTTRLGGK